MGEIGELINGRAYKKEELLKTGKYRVLRVGNLFTNNEWFYSNLELPKEKYCQAGDLLYAWSASFGPYIWNGAKTIFHYHIWNVRYNQSIVTRDYLYYFLEFDKSSIRNSTTGTTMIHISMENMNPRFIPLPPLAEQQRIVAKIEELMPLVEQYGKAQDELEALNSNIREQIKKSVLQYAIEGKLVPQCEEDGTAEDLLQEIHTVKQRLYTEGKLKKKDLTPSTIFRGEDNKYYEQIGKEVSDITEEIPYDLPNGWNFCRLSVLCWLDDGSKHFDEVLPYLDAKYQRGHSLPTYIQEGRLVEAQSKVILVDGENSGEVFITRERGYLGSTFKLLQSMPQVSATWMQYVLENYRPLLKGSKVGAAIPHLNKKLFHNLIIGLPCRKEQEFIAEQLDSMFQLMEG